MSRTRSTGRSMVFAIATAVVGAACAARSTGGAPPAPPATSSIAQKDACRVTPVSGCAQAPPSFASDVQPILRRRCLRCHSGDGPAAEEHDFSKLEVLRAQSGQLKDAIAACSMPPRSPLQDDEARTLLRWATCGAGAD